MTISELQIQLDISLGNEIEVLKQHAAHKTSNGYLFVDSANGQCYLLDEHGNIDDIRKVKCIQHYAFRNCRFLKSISIPNSVERIGDDAFNNCIALENIIIPDSVKSIGRWAFFNCTSFENIIIPDSVKSIGEYAFNNCTLLKEVIFKGKTIDKVKAMDNYPWDITDTSVIKCR